MMNPREMMFQQMERQNPQLFRRVKEMTEGKSDSQLKQIALNIAKERGIDLAGFASQYGFNI